MKNNIPFYIAILFLVIMLGAQWLETRTLRAELSSSLASLESKVMAFDAELGRAQTSLINSSEMMASFVSQIPKDIKADISSSFSNVEAILKGRIINASAGGGNVVRTTIKNKIPRADSEKLYSPAIGEEAGSTSDNEKQALDWKFKDWRLEASLIGDSFNYKLNQVFDLSLVETDKTYYLRVWELGPDGKRMADPLVVHSFSAVRSSASSWEFSFFDPQFELAATGLFTSISSPQIYPELATSLMSYKKENRRLIKALRAGIAIAPSWLLTFSPISYNIGYHLPVFDNIWISPVYGYDGNHKVGLSIGASL